MRRNSRIRALIQMSMLIGNITTCKYKHCNIKMQHQKVSDSAALAQTITSMSLQITRMDTSLMC
jgi:hypothetical protein